MVRFPAVWPDGGTGFRQVVFSVVRPLDRHLASVCRFCGRLCRASDRCGNLGHYGDRIGRKAALIATLLLTGLSTFLVGCVPTYEQIGIWGPVVLVVLRFIQGIGVGGEMARLGVAVDGVGTHQQKSRFP